MRLSTSALPLLLAALALPAGAQERNVACSGGMAGVYPCANVDLMAHMPLSTFAVTGSGAPSDDNDIWGWTDPATGREYALVGNSNGTSFVDVTNPGAPVFLGKLPTATDESPWRDIKVYNNHAFIVSEAGGHGMQVFNLTRLRNVTSPPVLFTADAHYTGVSNSHNIAINEATGFAYLVGTNTCAGGLHMVNIQNPLTPTAAGCFSADGYTHDTQCVLYDGPDAQFTGHEVCFSSNEDTVTITDVTNKAAPALIAGGRASYPSPGYTHQGWLTEDHRYFIVDDEGDETNGTVATTRKIVFDVSDLNAPSVAFEYFGPLLTIDHNLYVRGRYAYQSNYTSGLRILDLAGIDSNTLTEVASFDTYNQSNAVSFNGQWSNYPFFASGTVVANDIDNGLFVLRPTNLAVAAEPDPATGFALTAPAPNPTTGVARVELTLTRTQSVRAEAFDALGRRVAVVFDGPVAAGAPAALTFDATALPAGPYLLRITGEAFVASRRVTVAH
ncbi:MAG TPA: choice-of-anchor B family protein [Rhodothermales bacterium]|nr:choice-of-anchor B family protein [Rhodothermales bacterium]